MKSKLILILFCFISANIYAQGGTVKGKVIDAKDSLALIGANVIILNTKLGAATDINGFYEINNIPAGIYSVKVGFVGYTEVVSKNVHVKNSEDLTLNFKLEWDSTSTVIIVMEKTKPERIRRGCGIIPWSVDMIAIKEYYYLYMLDSLKQNPPKLKPVLIKPPRIEK